MEVDKVTCFIPPVAPERRLLPVLFSFFSSLLPSDLFRILALCQVIPPYHSSLLTPWKGACQHTVAHHWFREQTGLARKAPSSQPIPLRPKSMTIIRSPSSTHTEPHVAGTTFLYKRFSTGTNAHKMKYLTYLTHITGFLESRVTVV